MQPPGRDEILGLRHHSLGVDHCKVRVFEQRNEITVRIGGSMGLALRGTSMTIGVQEWGMGGDMNVSSLSQYSGTRLERRGLYNESVAEADGDGASQEFTAPGEDTSSCWTFKFGAYRC